MKNGQALISVLFIAIIGMTIATGAITSLMSVFAKTGKEEVAALAYEAAEGGVENGIMRIVRDPNYTGETLTFDASTTAIVSVSTASGVVITSVGAVGSVERKIVVTGHFTNLIWSVDSWVEIP